LTIDFLGSPGMTYQVGAGIEFTANASGIIAGVPATYALALLRAGCIPLTPKAWTDPR
jgi:hypothetical protein